MEIDSQEIVKSRRVKMQKPTQGDMTTAISIGRSYAQENYNDAYEQVMHFRNQVADQEMFRVIALIEAWDDDINGTEGLKELCARIRRRQV